MCQWNIEHEGVARDASNHPLALYPAACREPSLTLAASDQSVHAHELDPGCWHGAGDQDRVPGLETRRVRNGERTRSRRHVDVQQACGSANPLGMARARAGDAEMWVVAHPQHRAICPGAAAAQHHATGADGHASLAIITARLQQDCATESVRQFPLRYAAKYSGS